MEKIVKQIDEKNQLVSLVYMGMGTAFTSQVVVADNLISENLIAKIETAQAELEAWLWHVEEVFSPFIETSELNQFKRGELDFLSMSDEMRFVYVSCSQAYDATHHSFNAMLPTGYNPSGFVKGWAIEEGFNRYLMPLFEQENIIALNLNGGGDMQMATKEGADWTFGIGIVDPFDKMKIIAEVPMRNGAIATSGTAERGNHIIGADKKLVQTTVIGQSLQEVDVWATALMVDFETRMPANLRAFAVDYHGKKLEKVRK
ncbi:MAG: FAD:protein FMN transferase [Streptococcaceae bacterium]|jgi:thiamine biosynthesis lipoprotein|nr:FAD:protein FMN transferase [Streptococcaceae bacterium]